METESFTATVRLAQPGDGPGIANVHLNSWREAYGSILPDEFLARMPLTFQGRMKMWSQLLSDKPQGQQVWVAESEKYGVVGFAAVTPARDDKFKSSGELGAIYLLRHYHGVGVGYSLLRATMCHLRHQGFSKAYCWVLKDNPTIAFYQKTGGRLSGDTKIDSRGSLKLEELAVIWDDLSKF